MNQYLGQKLPGSLACFVGEDVYWKEMDVTNFAFEAASDELLESVDDDPVVTLTVPTGALYAKVTNTGANEFFYTTSGTDPNVANGMGVPVAANESVVVYGSAMAAFKAAAANGAATDIYVQYFDE